LTTAAAHAKVKTFWVAFVWHEGYLQRTPLREQRGSSISAFSQKHLTTSSLPNDDRPMIAPAARMISSCLLPADA
jgi:hypothetical protein